MAQQMIPGGAGGGLDDADDDEPSSGVIEDSFRVADVEGDTAQVLAHLRTRLLDLTLTNKLLNSKPESPRVVRVIDGLPDQLFGVLSEGARLEILPLPAPSPEHPLAQNARGAAKGERAKGDRKDRNGALDAYAKECGLSPSFDLPLAASGSPTHERHADEAVQTRMLPEELEKRVRAIAGDAKSAIDEKGSNILYLVFGFLEWSESPSSDRPLLAPLVMLPVSIERGEPDRKTGAYRYFLTYSDEDVLPNLSLQEKLRRDFNIALPDLEDEETPESYMARLAESVPLRPGWKIRRQVALGLLAFTKLFMYRDLEPKNWPEGKGPAEHPRIGELFRGQAGGEGADYAGEYDFEQESGERAPRAIPPIIVDADIHTIFPGSFLPHPAICARKLGACLEEKRGHG